MTEDRRRELRRRRILENTESRKDRICGLKKRVEAETAAAAAAANGAATPVFATSTPITAELQQSLAPASAPAPAKTPLTSRDHPGPQPHRLLPQPALQPQPQPLLQPQAQPPSHLQPHLQPQLQPHCLTEQQAESPPPDPPRARLGSQPIVHSASTDDFTLSSSFDPNRPSFPTLPNSPPLSPLNERELLSGWARVGLLCLLTCFLLSCQLGHVVCHSLLLPLFLYELHAVSTASAAEPSALVGPLAALLTPWQRVAAARVWRVAACGSGVWRDVCVYVCVAVLWHATVGLPEQGQREAQ